MANSIRVMLCVALCCLFMVPSAFANKNKVYTMGTVESVDVAGQSFVVKQADNVLVTLLVTPASEFEVEFKDKFKFDRDVLFTDLKVGDWVKVKSYSVGTMLQVDEVDIYR